MRAAAAPAARANLDPRAWGPQGWTFLSACAEACDEASCASYVRFLGLLPEVLPCASCRLHAAEYLADHPVDCRDLPAWLRAFRAAVRRRRAQGGGEEEGAASRFGLVSPSCAVLCVVASALLLVLLLLRRR